MTMAKTVLVTGGAGYIGSHCICELQMQTDCTVIAIDNFTNSVTDQNGQSMALKRVEHITQKPIIFYNCDLLDYVKLLSIFQKHQIDCVIHFAAWKAVGESMEFPLAYYRNNLMGLLNLLQVMETVECYQLVFSSSCTVYGSTDQLPIRECDEIGRNVTNVYGKTKYFIEEILRDVTRADPKWHVIVLRYFNPLGAHPSGLLGEDPTKPFTNIMPFLAQVAIGRRELFTVFGGDYDTPDGTGIRDYIHVMDLADGHVAALRHTPHLITNYTVYNLGTGRGVSVLELIKTFEKISERKIPYKIVQRREGDISVMYANPEKAKNELGWTTQRTLEQMCADFWKWQTLNPNGYNNTTENELIKGNGHYDTTTVKLFS